MYVCVCVHARARACVCVRVCMYVCTLKPRYYSWDLKLEDGCRRRRTETLEKETYAVISRKTRNPEKDTGWLQLEMLKKSEERSRREPKLIELTCCIHIHTYTHTHTHTHICIHRSTHKIIHNTQTYTTHATHTHTHTHIHTPKMHTWYVKDYQVGMKRPFLYWQICVAQARGILFSLCFNMNFFWMKLQHAWFETPLFVTIKWSHKSPKNPWKCLK